MQYWIFFSPGVGGDGFVNLLEHANNVEPADGNLYWRIDQIFSDTIKFYDPKWTEDPRPFRNLDDRELEKNVNLNKHYLELIENNINTVIPAHYFYFDHINDFKWKNIVEKNQIKINLYSLNTERVVKDFFLKHRITNQLDFEGQIFWANKNIHENLNSDKYDCHIDIEKVWTNWNYLEDKLKTLGIELDYNVYKTYLDIKDGKLEKYGINGGTVDAADTKVCNL